MTHGKPPGSDGGYPCYDKSRLVSIFSPKKLRGEEARAITGASWLNLLAQGAGETLHRQVWVFVWAPAPP